MHPIEGLPMGILGLDQTQRIVEVDPKVPELLGVEKSDLVGRAIDELFSPKDRKGALAFATKLSRIGSNGIVDVNIVLRLLGKDRLARLRVVPKEGGYLAYVEPSMGDSDFTHQFVLAQHRWDALVQRSEDGIVRLNGEGKIVEHNGRFFELMNFSDAHGVRLSEDALVGRSLATLLGKTLVPGLASYLQAPSGDFSASAKASGGRWLELRATPLSLPARGIAETFVVVRDVSDERRVRERDEVIARDLEGARAFQRAILSSAPPPPNDFDIDIFYEPVERVGGDLYDACVLDDGRLRLFVADATGHGVAAGLATMLIKGSYELVKKRESTPRLALRALNDHVAGSYAALEVVFTAAIVDVDVTNGNVRYAGGAHPPPILVENGRVIELEEGGAFVGAAPGLDYPEAEAVMNRGSGLYIFSDGFFEARNVENEFFGDGRLHKAIVSAHALSHGVANAIHDRVAAFTRPRLPEDDMTLLALRRA